MITKENFLGYCNNFYSFCKYPAAKYKILKDFLDADYDSENLSGFRKDFFASDIVAELYDEQSPYGDFGPLFSKNYKEKAVFPTTSTAIGRALYIGLDIRDSNDIIFNANEYLKGIFIKKEGLEGANERVLPGRTSGVASMLESIKPYNPLCDNLWSEWLYIATCAFEDGVYNYEKDRNAQHEIFFTREKRLIPIPLNLLLIRKENIDETFEKCLLDYYGAGVYEHGHFWDKGLKSFPEMFEYEFTRRWFYTINYINMFRNNAKYLDGAIEWLMKSQNGDGLWNYGTQKKDPWGYFGYFSLNKNYKYNKIVNCTMEVLSILKAYLVNNKKW